MNHVPRRAVEPVEVSPASGREPSKHEAVLGWFDFQDVYRTVVRSLSSTAPSVLVEVGSFLGKSTCYLAETVLASGKPARIDAVDTWELEVTGPDGMRDPSYVGAELPWVGDGLVEFSKNVSCRGLSRPVRPVRASSLDAADLHEPCSVDFVFLDALHDFEAVWEDLRAWWPKVRVGGFIGGHDYSTSGEPYPDVKEAVGAFFGFRGEDLFFVPPHSWLARKTCDSPVPGLPDGPDQIGEEELFGVVEAVESAIAASGSRAVADVGCWDGEVVSRLIAPQNARLVERVFASDTFRSCDRARCSDRVALVRSARKWDGDPRRDPYFGLLKRLERSDDDRRVALARARSKDAAETVADRSLAAVVSWTDSSPSAARETALGWAGKLKSGGQIVSTARRRQELEEALCGVLAGCLAASRQTDGPSWKSDTVASVTVR